MGKRNEHVDAVMGEFIDAFDEFVFCMHFASRGIVAEGARLAQRAAKKDQQLWIGSNLSDKTKMHARINISACISSCTKDGNFSNEIAKSLLCTMYSMWDEEYRHRIASVVACDAGNIVCPLMGDLRKIRHCIIHQKSIIPDNGIQFEVLKWRLPPGKLTITLDMFLELNDAVRGEGMRMHVRSLNPRIAEVLEGMNSVERKNFDDFCKKNRANNAEWPGMQDFLRRIGHQTN